MVYIDGTTGLMKASFQTWNTVCPAYDYTAAFPHEETDLYMVEQLGDWFPFAAAAVDGGALQFSCSGASTCMPLTTCVVGSERFNTELELMISEESPKVLVGEQRAVALVVGAKWQWAQTIQRSAENTLGIEIVSWPGEQSDPITILVEAVDTTIFSSTWSDHGAFLSDQVTVRGLESGVGLAIKVSYPCTSSVSISVSCVSSTPPGSNGMRRLKTCDHDHCNRRLKIQNSGKRQPKSL